MRIWAHAVDMQEDFRWLIPGWSMSFKVREDMQRERKHNATNIQVINRMTAPPEQRYSKHHQSSAAPIYRPQL